jgi:hypothetical protein
VHRFALLTAVVLAACALASPGQAASPTAGLPPGWSHASINVVIRHVAHTLTYDRGRVTAVAASSLILRERDGTVVTIAVSPTARVLIAGRPGSLAQVHRQDTATTMSMDGAPASLVKVQVPRGVTSAGGTRG